jgi:hypothetical protein
MPEVTYDDRSFMVDGERIWLVSGSLHYFRVPAPLWRDRLLKAKRAGLNCISTYVAWNVHEPLEGQWQFKGDQDVVEFVRLADELGLYVILRPGPYICAEWDFGGFPGWITTKSGMGYRTSNAAYMHYFDKYLANVLPRLAELQVTRGGSIILIQNENEYVMTTMPDRLNYLTFINQLYRRSGFEIPIINCNIFSDPPVSDNIECVNCWSDAVQQLKRMRLRRPDTPLLVTEYWDGWFDTWNGEHQARDAREVARRGLEIMGCAGQYNYYMWHGGTNFAFWGSSHGNSSDSYQTTSYDYDAPLSEGGGLTEKYYLTKLVNMLGTHMSPFLATCAMEEPGVTIHDSTTVLNMYGPKGRWAVVTNNGREEIETARISTPDGRPLEVPLRPLGAAAVPMDLQLEGDVRLDYSNLTPLGLFGDKILVLHGPEDYQGQVSVNGKAICETIPRGNEPKLIDHQGLLLVLVNSDLGQRTWFADETLLFGPDFVGETADDVTFSASAKQYALLSMDGKLTHRKLKPVSKRKPTAPRVSSWTRRRVCVEPVSKDLEWQELDRPTDLDRLGVHYGYAWYQIRMQSPRVRKRYLMIPNCADRATTYLNGKLLGVWGNGSGASRKPIPANFKRGQNILTLLVDNLGRVKIGSRLGEPKGLYGHIFDARPLRTKKFRLRKLGSFSKRVIPRGLSHMTPELEKLPVYSAEVDIPLAKVIPIHMSITGLPCHAAVVCNDRAVGFFPSRAVNYGELVLGAELKRGRNSVKLMLWGEVSAKALDLIRFHVLSENLTQDAHWSWRKWKLPTGEGPVVGKNQPAWYIAKFRYTPADTPLFLRILNAKKGQIFLNGRNVGRFWNVGPQQCYYLPECWLARENELLIFEETGNIPSGSRLEFRALGPYRE